VERDDEVLAAHKLPEPAALSSDRGGAVGALAPGVTLHEAAAEMNGIARQPEPAYPESNTDWRVYVERRRMTSGKNKIDSFDGSSTLRSVSPAFDRTPGSRCAD
jgi:hypothetical protein